MRYKLETTLTVGGGAVLKNLDCEWQKFLLAHRRWGTFRETSLRGDELGETLGVRRLHIPEICLSTLSVSHTINDFRGNHNTSQNHS